MLLNNLFVSEVFGLQKNCEDSTETHAPPSAPHDEHLTVRWTGVSHSEGTAVDTSVISKVHTLFRRPSFSPKTFSVPGPPPRGSTLHREVTSLTVFVLDDLDSSEGPLAICGLSITRDFPSPEVGLGLGSGRIRGEELCSPRRVRRPLSGDTLRGRPCSPGSSLPSPPFFSSAPVLFGRRSLCPGTPAGGQVSPLCEGPAPTAMLALRGEETGLSSFMYVLNCLSVSGLVIFFASFGLQPNATFFFF